MSRQKSPAIVQNESHMILSKILTEIKTLISTASPMDKTTKEEILETIDSVLQTQSVQKKRLESTILLSLETLQIFLEEPAKIAKIDVDKKLVQEIFILGKLLERVYIYSTDIEYAQFYNKELALRVDKLINDRRLRLECQLNDVALQENVEAIFSELENRKVNYFKFFKKRELERIKREN